MCPHYALVLLYCYALKKVGILDKKAGQIKNKIQHSVLSDNIGLLAPDVWLISTPTTSDGEMGECNRSSPSRTLWND